MSDVCDIDTACGWIGVCRKCRELYVLDSWRSWVTVEYRHANPTYTMRRCPNDYNTYTGHGTFIVDFCDGEIWALPDQLQMLASYCIGGVDALLVLITEDVLARVCLPWDSVV